MKEDLQATPTIPRGVLPFLVRIDRTPRRHDADLADVVRRLPNWCDVYCSHFAPP